VELVETTQINENSIVLR